MYDIPFIKLNDKIVLSMGKLCMHINLAHVQQSYPWSLLSDACLHCFLSLHCSPFKLNKVVLCLLAPFGNNSADSVLWQNDLNYNYCVLYYSSQFIFFSFVLALSFV